MKKLSLILFLIAYLFIPTKAQSVSKEKINIYLKSQNLKFIESGLAKLGFIYNRKEMKGDDIIYFYEKGVNFDKEYFNVGYNARLFILQYVPIKNYFTKYKKALLTPDFVYKYTYGNSKYYENNIIRIEIDENVSIISFFINKK